MFASYRFVGKGRGAGREFEGTSRERGTEIEQKVTDGRARRRLNGGRSERVISPFRGLFFGEKKIKK